MMRIAALLTLVALPAALAAEDWRYARIRHVEPGVSVQSAAEAASEEASPNLPFLPGDRVWTDESGRVEFQFAEGSLVRLDAGSKLDYSDHQGDRQRGRAILRLWSGGAYLHARGSRGTEFEVETPGGVVVLAERGIVRIDTRSGEVRVSVYEGRATFEGDGEEDVSAGERLLARRGAIEAGPEPFDRGDRDEFALWVEERDSRAYARRGSEDVELYDELLPYAGELDGYGSWVSVAEVGHVWRPHVGPAWRPYLHGRWAWTAYGWTWVSSDPWGWAPFHYGRWGYGLNVGWYWIPGRTWGPAWVSWAVGPRHVGWCPLGYRDRPVVWHGGRHHPRGFGNRGRAVPRGATVAEHSPWVYASHGDLRARDVARKVVSDDAVARDGVRVAPSPTHRPDRDLRIVDQPVTRRTTPRNVRTRPTPGDTVPELRTDNLTTIPFPVARRRRGDDDDRQNRPAFGDAAGDTAGAGETTRTLDAPVSTGGTSRGRERWRRAAPAPAPDGASTNAAPPSGERPERVIRRAPPLRPAPDAAETPAPRTRQYRSAPRDASRPPAATGGETRERYRAPGADTVRPAAPESRARKVSPPAAAPAPPAPRAEGGGARPAPAPRAERDGGGSRPAPAAREGGRARSRERNNDD